MRSHPSAEHEFGEDGGLADVMSLVAPSRGPECPRRSAVFRASMMSTIAEISSLLTRETTAVRRITAPLTRAKPPGTVGECRSRIFPSMSVGQKGRTPPQPKLRYELGGTWDVVVRGL